MFEFTDDTLPLLKFNISGQKYLFPNEFVMDFLIKNYLQVFL